MTAGRERFGLRRILVVSQVALSLVLLVGSLLFVRTLRNLLTLDPGFRQDNTIVASLDLVATTSRSLSARNSSAIYWNVSVLYRASMRAADVSIVPVSGNGWNENFGSPGTKSVRRFRDSIVSRPDISRR